MTIGMNYYFERVWEYLGWKGWRPGCGKAVYIRRNSVHVRRNLKEDPEYMTKRLRRIEETD